MRRALPLLSANRVKTELLPKRPFHPPNDLVRSTEFVRPVCLQHPLLTRPDGRRQALPRLPLGKRGDFESRTKGQLL